MYERLEIEAAGGTSIVGQSSGGAVLTAFAVLFVLLAISNFSKPLNLSPNAGFVFFGVKTSGKANAILGPLVVANEAGGGAFFRPVPASKS